MYLLVSMQMLLKVQKLFKYTKHIVIILLISEIFGLNNGFFAISSNIDSKVSKQQKKTERR